MLSGKDIFRQGKEIVRIVLYKCHIGSYTPRHTKMESKKKKKRAVIECLAEQLRELMN